MAPTKKTKPVEVSPRPSTYSRATPWRCSSTFLPGQPQDNSTRPMKKARVVRSQLQVRTGSAIAGSVSTTKVPRDGDLGLVAGFATSTGKSSALREGYLVCSRST
jgi:hypothetical protein